MPALSNSAELDGLGDKGRHHAPPSATVHTYPRLGDGGPQDVRVAPLSNESGVEIRAGENSPLRCQKGADMEQTARLCIREPRC